MAAVQVRPCRYSSISAGNPAGAWSSRFLKERFNRYIAESVLSLCNGVIHQAVKRAEVLAVCFVAEWAFPDARKGIDRIDYVEHVDLVQWLLNREAAMQATLRSNDTLLGQSLHHLGKVT